MGLALGTVILRVWSRLAVKGRLATDDTLILLGTASKSPSTGFRVGADELDRVAQLPGLSSPASAQTISWDMTGRGEYYLFVL